MIRSKFRSGIKIKHFVQVDPWYLTKNQLVNQNVQLYCQENKFLKQDISSRLFSSFSYLGFHHKMGKNIYDASMKNVLVQNKKLVLKNDIKLASGMEQDHSNGEAQFNVGSSDFLKYFPRGSYTSARTLHDDSNENLLKDGIINKENMSSLDWSIFQYDFHVQRMVNSLKVMTEEFVDSDEQLEMYKRDSAKYDILNVDWMNREMMENIQVAVDQFFNIYTISREEDLKVTVLVSFNYATQKTKTSVFELSQKQEGIDSFFYDIFTHVTVLSERPDEAVLVDARNGSRLELKAKDSVWIQMRNGMLQRKTPNANEVLLCEPTGHIREGASSNIFVVRNGVVITADDGVVEGTVRQLVIEVCKEQNIPFEFQVPSLENMVSADDEIFITSTSRLVLPVSELVIPEECWNTLKWNTETEKHCEDDNLEHEKRKKRVFKDQPISNLLYKHLKEKLFKMSKKIY